ncbi:hypothetical protein F444_23082 [Phytophthora nicotianae P1976]|uniref:Ubiquitin-like protease family profile domain-containing protein n=1 Tax=Phytophthora nicotianae P1976 TaxID=1317066 RepID=A0A080YVX9_PHYNI|nr:hypothetical protein F444_23082 [Phytophthora nicotianae P1976]
MSLPCRHSIAYRKHNRVSGPLIPWNRIDERWTTPSQELKKVKQFTYEKFVDGEFGSIQKKLRTQFERYREAVRATHLIANEMADIEDEAEFEEMLKFVLAQWRNVRLKKMATISGDASGDLSAESPKRGEERYTRDREQEALVKNEFNISSSDEDEEDRSQTSVGDDGTDEDASKTGKRVEIRLNLKARKVGRPQKQKKKTAAGEKKDRRWYETREAARAQAGEVSLLALVDSLDREQPGLKETQRRLSGVIVKHGEAEKKKPKLKLMKNPVLTMDPFYLLPTKLLDACVKLLPVSNTEDSVITVDDSQPSQTSRTDIAEGYVETLVIKDVGSYSRKQIETFQRVQILKDFVELGLKTHEWLLDVALPTLPSPYDVKARQVADDVMEAYPYKHIQGLPDGPDFAYTVLYRAAPPLWLTDFDGHSCGVFVCWMFIGQVIPGRHLKVNIETLTKRRFELFYYLLTGQLLPLQTPQDDEDEEKMPAPSAEHERSDDEDIPPTQVQQ